MKSEGGFVEIMSEVNSEYYNFLIYDKGKNVLYVLILKAVYGMIESALLWYDLFSTPLSDLGSELNPCERCIANKFIDEHQCTIGWFLDNNKVSHMDDSVNLMISDKTEEKNVNLSHTKRKKHTFLSMEIDFIGRNKSRCPCHIMLTRL